MSFNRLLNINSVYLLKIILLFHTSTYFVEGEPAPQNKSFLKYMNPKFVRDVNVTMYRLKKSNPYATNITVTTLHTWGSNVTILISYPTDSGKEFKMNTKLCDLTDKLWVVEVFRLHSNITECPQPAATYRFYNLVALPKVLPPPIATPPRSSTGFVNLSYYITATKEKLLEIHLLLRFKGSV